MKEYQQNTIKVPRFSEANGFYTTQKRSELMSKIRSKNTKPEQKLRKLLWALGLRYRLNDNRLPGKPDIVLKKYKLAIFIDGEFWHGHNWEEKKQTIKSNREFWIPKIERNIQRDNEVTQNLHQQGYKVIRLWEQQITKDLNWCLQIVLDTISETLNENTEIN